MKDKLQTWCLIIGVSMWGPVLLGVAVTWLFMGEIPGRRGPLVRAIDSPIVFYVAVIAFIGAGMKWTQISWVLGRLFYTKSRRRTDIPH